MSRSKVREIQPPRCHSARFVTFSLGAAGLVILIGVVIVASDRIIERWYKWSGRPFTVQYCVADIVRFPEVRGDDAKLRELIEKEIWYERTDVADEIVAVARGEIRVRTTFLGHQRVSAFLEAVRNLLDDNRVDLPAWRLEPRR